VCMWTVFVSGNRLTAKGFSPSIRVCVRAWDCRWSYSNVGQQALVAWTSRSVVGRGRVV
jgi:hypothetical protein